MLRNITIGALLGCLLGLGQAQPLSAGWGDEPAPPADSAAPAADREQPANAAGPEQSAPKPPVVIEDSPSWEKYAFTLPLAEGEGSLRFADLARSGRPFVLVWWLSDCPVCNMQMPYVSQLARLGDNADANVWVVGINIDTNDDECARYMRSKKLPFDVLRDPRGRRTDANYDVRDEGTPMTWVFKPGGVYAGKLSGYTKNYPDRVLGLLGLDKSESSGSGIVIERADGTKQTRTL